MRRDDAGVDAEVAKGPCERGGHRAAVASVGVRRRAASQQVDRRQPVRPLRRVDRPAPAAAAPEARRVIVCGLFLGQLLAGLILGFEQLGIGEHHDRLRFVPLALDVDEPEHPQPGLNTRGASAVVRASPAVRAPRRHPRRTRAPRPASRPRTRRRTPAVLGHVDRVEEVADGAPDPGDRRTGGDQPAEEGDRGADDRRPDPGDEPRERMGRQRADEATGRPRLAGLGYPRSRRAASGCRAEAMRPRASRPRAPRSRSGSGRVPRAPCRERAQRPTTLRGAGRRRRRSRSPSAGSREMPRPTTPPPPNHTARMDRSASATRPIPMASRAHGDSAERTVLRGRFRGLVVVLLREAGFARDVLRREGEVFVAT